MNRFPNYYKRNNLACKNVSNEINGFITPSLYSLYQIKPHWFTSYLDPVLSQHLPEIKKKPNWLKPKFLIEKNKISLRIFFSRENKNKSWIVIRFLFQISSGKKFPPLLQLTIEVKQAWAHWARGGLFSPTLLIEPELTYCAWAHLLCLSLLIEPELTYWAHVELKPQ